MTRDELLSPKVFEIDLPSGGKVKARKLKQAELLKAVKAEGEDVNQQAFAFSRVILLNCVLNDDGTRMFADEDAGLLDSLDIDDTKAIVKAVQKASGINVEETAAPKND